MTKTKDDSKAAAAAAKKIIKEAEGRAAELLQTAKASAEAEAVEATKIMDEAKEIQAAAQDMEAAAETAVANAAALTTKAEKTLADAEATMVSLRATAAKQPPIGSAADKSRKIMIGRPFLGQPGKKVHNPNREAERKARTRKVDPEVPTTWGTFARRTGFNQPRMFGAPSTPEQRAIAARPRKPSRNRWFPPAPEPVSKETQTKTD